MKHMAILSEGLRPSDSPTRALARRFAGALRARGSLATLARVALLLTMSACARETPKPSSTAAPVQNVVLITIDTLRADYVSAYGELTLASTPAIDALARGGARFVRAYATAPVTLPSHASMMTGRYPPGHGARHNGMRVDLKIPTLAEAFARAGFTTGAFIAAFPLDRRFGLIKGFQTYADTMPRDAGGRQANDKPGRLVVDEALAWIAQHRGERVFLWVHLFEPHAPYGNAASTAQKSATLRYRDDVIEADAQVKRLIDGLGFDPARTLFAIASDHGEAFGEHGEISHSVFTYDTTLRVPLIVAGPGFAAGTVARAPVSLVDVAPTVAAAAGLGTFDSDGRDLRSTLDLPPEGGSELQNKSDRPIYSETFAPLLDFGWSPLRAIRLGQWKYIAAPKPELYDLSSDPGENNNVIATEGGVARAADLARRIDAISPATLAAASSAQDREALARLQALGYASGRGDAGGTRADPKDRKELAAQIARVASGELSGGPLERALRDILRADPANPQANLRLGYVLQASNNCAEAMRRFTAAIDGHLPSADAHLGRAGCEVAAKNFPAALRTLTAAMAMEPDNPVVIANLGLVTSDSGQPAAAIPHLQRALSLDPGLHQARFGLAVALLQTGKRADAAREAEELLRRLPAGAPQRAEVERLLAATR